LLIHRVNTGPERPARTQRAIRARKSVRWIGERREILL